MSLLFHSRWQHLLSPLRGFAAAALGKRIGSSVRPPKNEQLNLARDLIWRKDQGYDVWKDDIEWAILRALCGIGEMVHELREDQECYDERMTTQRSLQIGDHVRINEYSAIFKISHFDELGMQAYLLPAPSAIGGAKDTCCWQPINKLELVEEASHGEYQQILN